MRTENSLEQIVLGLADFCKACIIYIDLFSRQGSLARRNQVMGFTLLVGGFVVVVIIPVVISVVSSVVSGIAAAVDDEED